MDIDPLVLAVGLLVLGLWLLVGAWFALDRRVRRLEAWQGGQQAMQDGLVAALQEEGYRE